MAGPSKLRTQLPLVSLLFCASLCGVSAAPNAAPACPSLAEMRTAHVAKSFDPRMMAGPWFEQAYIDIAQLGAACQTLYGHFNASTQVLSMDFRVRYGPIPFTIVEDYEPFNNKSSSTKGLYIKRAEMPGAGLLTLPTVFVDAVPSQDGTTYEQVTIFSCTTKLGQQITELVIATRASAITATQLETLQDVARRQGVQWKPGELKRVNRSDCPSPPPPNLSTAAGDDDSLVRAPAGKVGPSVGMILVQGAQIPTARYRPLAEALVNAVPFPLSIAVPAFIADLPEPIQMGSCVSRALKALDLPKGALVFAAGHSLGAVMIQDYAFQQSGMFHGLLLMGGALQRKYRNGTASHNYPLPWVVLDGTLDGLYRVTRQAETFYHALGSIDAPTPAQRAAAAGRTAVVVYDGVNHMQFASGAPPATVAANDLPAEVGDAEAHEKMAATIAAWLCLQISPTGTALEHMVREMSETGQLMRPLIAALQQEGFVHFSPPCDSDYPMPDCPHYPRYPSKAQGTHPKPSGRCTCGTPWSAQAQQHLGGQLASRSTWHVVDAIHSVSDVLPVHLPHLWSHCDEPSTRCLINATTVTQPMRASLDSFDTGFSLISATELRVKLSSRQSLELVAGAPSESVNFTQTDVIPSLCAEINQQAWEWALQNAGEVASQRFQRRGTPLVMANDTFLGNAGPLWIENPLKLKPIKGGDGRVVAVSVSAPCSHTDVDYPIKAAAGFHYCKLLSPARAMEWIFTDGLRGNVTSSVYE